MLTPYSCGHAPHQCCLHLRNNSRMSSCFPSRISLNPRIVSAIGTYFPSKPVNCVATKNGWDKNLCNFLARLTTSLSSLDSSSIPKIAMISCNSLYFCKISLHTTRHLKMPSPTIRGSRILEVEASGSTAG